MRILKLLFNISVFSLVLAQFSAIYKNGETSIYAFDIFIGLFAVFGLFYFLSIKRSLIIPSVSVIFLAFSFIAIISLIHVIPVYNSWQLLVGLFYLIRWLLYLTSAVVIYNILHNYFLAEELSISKSNSTSNNANNLKLDGIKINIFSKDYLITSFINSGVILSFIGVLQLAIFPDLSLLDESLGWDPHKFRLFATFLDPNFIGAYLTMVIVFILDKYYQSRDGYEKFYLWDLTTFLIVLLGIFLTFSRSAWLMFSIVILIYGLYKSKALLLTFMIIAFAAYFAVPRIQTRISGITDPADSAQFRFISWKNTYEIAKDNLLLGVGFNTFRYAQLENGYVDYDSVSEHSSSGADSSLLFILATTGIFGLLFYLGGYVYTYFRTQSLIVKSLILGLLLNSLFINSLFYPQIMFWILIILVSQTFFDN